MKALLLTALIASSSVFATYGRGNGDVVAQGHAAEVDLYMDVNSADCYDTTANAKDLVDSYAVAGRSLRLNVHVVNKDNDQVVRFVRRANLVSRRGVSVRVVRNVGAVRFVRFGNFLSFRVGRAVVFSNRGAFTVSGRRRAQRIIDARVRF